MSRQLPKILVVGGAGYIGSHVTKALRDKGKNPVVFDNLSTGSRDNLINDVPFVHGDLFFPEDILSALENVESIIHLAGLKSSGKSMSEPQKYAFNNISGTINLINAAVKTGVKNFVFSSSAAVYGEPNYIPLDEKHPTNPTSFYGQTKLHIEELLTWFSYLKNLRQASLRYFNAAGYDPEHEIIGLEKSPNNLLPLIFEVIFKKRSFIEIYGSDYNTKDGTCIRDYIHVTDLADAHVKSLEYLDKENKDLTINLGTSKGLSVLQIIEYIKKISNFEIPIKKGARRKGDPAIVISSAIKAKKILNWNPKYSNIDTLIETMLYAYKANS